MSKEKSYKIKDDLYIGIFQGRSNAGPLRTYISISDDENPGIGEWLTLAEARKLLKALSRLLKAEL